jgi:hypothetical protein
MNKKFKLFAIALMTGTITLGTQSCSKDNEPEDIKAGDVKVTSVTVEPSSKTLQPGGTFTLVATVLPATATDKSVTWTSSNTGVATVDDKGVVTAKTVGEANITVASVANPEKKATCAITVKETVPLSISLNTEALQILKGATKTLIATTSPDDAQVTWTSSSTGVATIEGGVVTGIAVGTATITAALTDDPDTKAECTVTVVDVDAPAVQSLVGMWTFENADNLLEATTGEALEVSGDYTSIDGPDGTKAVDPVGGAYFMIHHNIGPNGGEDASYTNEYTLMMDIRGSQDDFNNWLSVFVGRDAEGNWTDGEAVLWINGSGQIGFAELYSENGGYSAPVLTADTWHRVVVAANLAEGLFKVYVDGALVFTANKNNNLNGRVSLEPDVVRIGGDNTNYPGPEFAEVRMWSIQLTDEQVTELGAPTP